MRLIQYTIYGYMQLSLAHFKCHEEISDSPTTRFRVTLHRCFGEHLGLPFGKGDLWMIVLTLVTHKRNFMHIWKLLNLGRLKKSARTA